MSSPAEQRRATERAVENLTRAIRERDAESPEDRAEARAFALTFMNAMLGHGWKIYNPSTHQGAALARQVLARAIGQPEEGQQ
jgi:hypothetical protein